MSNNLQGKVIAVTGGASGIGLETAKILASRGAKVSIADLQEDMLNEAESAIRSAGGAIIATVVNVRERKQVEAWISKTVETYGKLDGAVNVAGVNGRQNGVANIEDIDDDDWDFVMGVNLNGVLNSMRAEIKAMKDHGSLVNVSSVAGVIGMPQNGAYVAAKHAVVGLTRASAKELGGRGIRVNVVTLGPIDTPMVRNANPDAVANVPPVALKRFGKASEVAELIAWLVCDGSSYITGTVQSVDGGWVC